MNQPHVRVDGLHQPANLEGLVTTSALDDDEMVEVTAYDVDDQAVVSGEEHGDELLSSLV
ncbi:MAG TPA: hypothetical protein VMZ66_02520 [Aeromicrobium sp.]|nr:hypothetical protein [Aeromicrobium sp.]